MTQLLKYFQSEQGEKKLFLGDGENGLFSFFSVASSAIPEVSADGDGDVYGRFYE